MYTELTGVTIMFYNIGSQSSFFVHITPDEMSLQLCAPNVVGPGLLWLTLNLVLIVQFLSRNYIYISVLFVTIRYVRIPPNIASHTS